MCFSWYLSWPQLSEKIIAVFISKREQIFWRNVCHSIDVRGQINKEGTIMKTQEEYAHEIDKIVLQDVKSCQSDWFKIDKPTFMSPENKNKSFILATRLTGCEMLIFGSECCERDVDRILGNLSNNKFYICFPIAIREQDTIINEISGLYAVKEISQYYAYRNQAIVYKNMHWELVNIK